MNQFFAFVLTHESIASIVPMKSLNCVQHLSTVRMPRQSVPIPQPSNTNKPIMTPLRKLYRNKKRKENVKKMRKNHRVETALRLLPQFSTNETD